MKVNYTEDLDELWTINDVCDYFKIERRKAYKLFNISTFPGFKIGKEYRVPKRLLLKWVVENFGKTIHI